MKDPKELAKVGVKILPGDRVTLRTVLNDHQTVQFIAENSLGVGVLTQGGEYRFFPYANVVSLTKKDI